MKNRNKPHTNILKQAILSEHRTYFVILLILSGAAISAEVYASIVFRNWLNLLDRDDPTLSALAYGLLIPALYAASWLLNALFFRLDIDARFLVYRYALSRMVERSIAGTVDLLTRAKPGRIMQDVRSASESVANMYNMLAFYGFRFVVILIAAIILLGSIAWWAPIVVFALSAVSMLLSYRQHTVCIEHSKAHVEDQGVTSGNLVEVFERLRIVKTFKQEGGTLSRIDADVEQEGVSKRRLRSSFLTLSLIQIGYKTAVILLFLTIGIVGFANGTLKLGSLGMLITFSMTLSNVIEDLTVRLYELVSNYTKYKQVLANIDLDKREVLNMVAVESANDKSRIQINDLTVKAGSEVILDGVSLSLPADKKVAMMGPSGCGKTTLAECILGLRNYAGSIEFISPKKRLPKIVEVEQNPVHIGETLHQWLTFGNQHASAGLVEQAIETAVLTDIVEPSSQAKLRPGLTLNGLSRGQKQRAAIARALIAEPNYIIFDEPTSALDEATAQTIFSNISELGTGVLVITHDRQSRHLFDEIFEFDAKTFRESIL